MEANAPAARKATSVAATGRKEEEKMILGDLKTELANRLLSDAYFTDPERPVGVLSEDRMDLTDELDKKLATKGLVAVVALRRLDRVGQRGETVVGIMLEVHEVPVVNRSSRGAQKRADEVCLKAVSLWGEPWRVYGPGHEREGMWSPLDFTSWEMAEVDPENGRVIWAANFTTLTFLDTIVEVAGTEGEMLVDESGAGLLLSPTEP